MKKYCTKCGKPFDAVGREVICPSCKAQAAAETKRAAVLRAKKASWAGEAVPVRISGRASTVIREYGKAHDVSFVEALDALLRTTDFFLQTLDMAWVDVVPYKSHRRDKHATHDTQDTQTAQDTPQDTAQDVKTPQAAKAASKASKPQAASKPVKAASKPVKAAKTSASKASKE